MRVGLDFDNTIVCYDEAFHQLAMESGAIPADLPRVKEKVKAYLQQRGRNDFWTELQGLAYGPRMESAATFPGFENFLNIAKQHQAEIFIVSHRSPKPYSGLDYDLHAAAKAWLHNRPWISSQQISMQNVYFEATKKEKIQRIADLKLDFFVDDLVEIFKDADFPQGLRKIHFRPGAESSPEPNLIHAKNWDDVLRIFKSL